MTVAGSQQRLGIIEELLLVIVGSTIKDLLLVIVVSSVEDLFLVIVVSSIQDLLLLMVNRITEDLILIIVDEAVPFTFSRSRGSRTSPSEVDVETESCIPNCSIPGSSHWHHELLHE